MQIGRTRVQNESFVPVERRKEVLRKNVLERIRTSKSVILRPKEGETLLELRKSLLEMLKSVEASPEKSPKISAIKSNEAKNFFVVDLLNEVEQGKVEDLIKSKLVFSRTTGFDPAVTVYNVLSDLTEGEILEALVAKNGLILASGEKKRLKVCRRFRNCQRKCDVVVRMAPAMHRQLGEKDKRVFLLFLAHPYKNRVQTLRCSKCYGHTDVKGSCKNIRVCGRCGEKDHVAAKCTGKARCVNCMRAGRGRSAEGGRQRAIRPLIQNVPFTRSISQSFEHALPTNG